MLLEFRDVSKAYLTPTGHRTVLDNVSFRVERGQSIGILGGNGAGKSTLLRIIAGTQKPDSGEVRRGVHFSWPMGFSGGFNTSLTGEENLRFVSRIYGANLRKVREFVEDFSELGSYLDMPIKTYSSGMRAKLAFGLSMAIDFECYLIDEIMGVGDVKFQEKCRDFFHARKEHSDLIIVSHNMKNIRENCDIAAILYDGGITLYEDIKEAIEVYEGISPSPAKQRKLRRKEAVA